jgi:cytochrome b561
MSMRNTEAGYGTPARFLHWASALAVVSAFALGQLGEAFGKTNEAALVFAHIQAGLAVLALLAVRIVWRHLDPPPPPAASRFDPWAARAAKAGHWALYALLLAVPLAGLATLFARGQPLNVAGLVEFASPWVRDRALARSAKEIHETLSDALVLLAFLHALAALAHHYVFKDATLRRMLGGT